MASRTPSASRLSPEERIGLGVALAAHVALFGWLALDQPGRDLVPPPERMTVSFAEEVAPQSTAPAPMAEAAPEVAPTRGEAAPEPEPEPLRVERPEPVVQPQPLPRVIPAPQPRPVPKAVPTRTPPKTASAARPVASAATRPVPKAASKAAAGARPADERTRRRPDAPQGASRLGNDFLKGLPGGQVAGAATTPPAAKAGAQVAASLRQAVARQLKPHWVAPQGVDVDQLRTTISWSLNLDGSLAGRPTLDSQEGVSDANRAQAQRHVEQAIRAVQLAEPFELPEQYYNSWKKLRFTFDRNLSR